jgi:RHS repeat-associated protein
MGTRFYQYDGQLSTRQLTDTAGGATDTYTYDAFGVLLAFSGTTPNVYLYGGEQLDPNIGFYYLRARYYAQALGRFITTDPERGSIFDPASLHRYLYANANPITFGDPSGKFVQGLIAAVGTIVLADIAIGAASSAITFLIVKGVPRDLKSAAEFGADVIAGGVGGGLSAIPLAGPYLAGALAVLKQMLVLHYIARQNIYAYDVYGSVILNVFVGGTIGLGLQALTGNVAQAGFQGGLSTATDDILRWVGGMIGVAQGSNSGNAEQFLSEGFVGGKGEVFWCAADSRPTQREACPKSFAEEFITGTLQN